MFETKGHQTQEFVEKFISFGIVEAKISKIEYVKSQIGTEGMKITHSTKPESALGGEGKTAETTFWMSANAWSMTKDRIVIMADKLNVRNQLDSISSESAEDYVNKVAKVFVGKTARWKFAGKEIPGKEGKQSWFKAELAPFGFVESLDISKEQSKLKFNPDKDLKKLPISELELSGSTANGEANSVGW